MQLLMWCHIQCLDRWLKCRSLSLPRYSRWLNDEMSQTFDCCWLLKLLVMLIVLLLPSLLCLCRNRCLWYLNHHSNCIVNVFSLWTPSTSLWEASSLLSWQSSLSLCSDDDVISAVFASIERVELIILLIVQLLSVPNHSSPLLLLPLSL